MGHGHASGGLCPACLSVSGVTVGGSASASPVAAVAACISVRDSAASRLLGLPCVSGTGIPELDELFMLECEAGFAEDLGLREPEFEGDVFCFDSG